MQCRWYLYSCMKTKPWPTEYLYIDSLRKLIAAYFLHVVVVGSTNEIVVCNVVPETRSQPTSYPKARVISFTHNTEGFVKLIALHCSILKFYVQFVLITFLFFTMLFYKTNNRWVKRSLITTLRYQASPWAWYLVTKLHKQVITILRKLRIT